MHNPVGLAKAKWRVPCAHACASAPCTACTRLDKLKSSCVTWQDVPSGAQLHAPKDLHKSGCNLFPRTLGLELLVEDINIEFLLHDDKDVMNH